MITTNLSKSDKILSTISLLSTSRRSRKDFVISEYDDHASHAVIYLYQRKQRLYVSQPVNEWNTGKACDLAGPKAKEISWIGNHCKVLPAPNWIHSWATLISLKYDIASTLTSVSTVLMANVWAPQYAAWQQCKIRRVSASSWEHGEIISVSRIGQHRTFSSRVTSNCLSWKLHAVKKIEQFSFIVIDMEKFLPICWNFCGWCNASSWTCASFYSSRWFKTVLQVYAKYHVNSVNLSEKIFDIW